MLNIIKKRDQGITGRFEVTIVPIQMLIHSKATKRQGVCTNSREVQAVIDQIYEYLDSLK